MLLRLTERDENCLHAFFVSSKQKCHPDRSAAKWRDLLFILRSIESEWKRHRPLCHPDRSEAEWRDLQCARRSSQILRNKPLHPSRGVIPAEAEGSTVQRTYLGNVSRLTKRDAARVISRQPHLIDNFLEFRMMS